MVVVVDLATIIEIKIMQKMQVVAEEEETKEQGGVIEAEVDGNNAITVIQMVARYVAKQGTTQMSAIITKEMTEGVISHSKETMCLHPTMIMMDAYLLCST